jgi:hypothetical protein
VPDSIELNPVIHGPTGLPPCPATARAGRIATQAYRYTYSIFVCGVPDSIELNPVIHGPTGLPPCPATARAGRIATQAYRYTYRINQL